MPTETERDLPQEVEEMEKLEDMKSVAILKGFLFGVFITGLIILMISIFLGWPW